MKTKKSFTTKTKNIYYQLHVDYILHTNIHIVLMATVLPLLTASLMVEDAKFRPSEPRPGQVPVSAEPWLLARFPRCLLVPPVTSAGHKQQTCKSHLLSQLTQRNVSFLFVGSLENLSSIVCVQYEDQHILYWEVLPSVLCSVTSECTNSGK